MQTQMQFYLHFLNLILSLSIYMYAHTHAYIYFPISTKPLQKLHTYFTLKYFNMYFLVGTFSYITTSVNNFSKFNIETILYQLYSKFCELIQKCLLWHIPPSEQEPSNGQVGTSIAFSCHVLSAFLLFFMTLMF